MKHHCLSSKRTNSVKVVFNLNIEVWFFLNLFIYFYFCLPWVFVAARGLFSSCGERGLLFIAVRGLLIVVASLVEEHGL